MNFAFSIFKFFASLRLAIFLLLALALVFAIGTFLESAYGTETAKLLVYRSLWLNGLLVLLTLNLAASALDRLPWKKKHVGFVLTHTGIIILLLGSLVTRAYGVEGQMAVREGSSASRIILNEAMLQVFSKELGPLGLFKIPAQAFPWQGKKKLGAVGASKVSLLRYYPKSKREEKIEAASEGPAALQVALESSFMKASHWLILDDPEKEQILLGPAELRFSREPMAPKPEAPETPGFLEFQFDGMSTPIQIPLPESTPQKIALAGTPYQITIQRILRDAAVDQNRLLDQSQEWRNPACELILEGKGIKEKHTVFSNFPDFPTLHGMKPSEAGVHIYYRRPGEAASADPKNELRFIWREGRPPLYQIRKGKEISEGEIRLGEEKETGWMDFKFRVEHYHPHARARSNFEKAPVNHPSEEDFSAVQIQLGEGAGAKTLWLGQGDNETLSQGGHSYEILYGLRTLPVGFRLELRDFRVENYPGTSRPVSFESDVTLKDDSAGVKREATIRMNQPLSTRGFKIFQSGYQQNPGEREVSIFTVAKDPGVPIKYFGSIVLIGGILAMFYTRQFSNRPADKKHTPEMIGAVS